jgi:uncharacterized protein YbjT (DUF2867 family)
MILVTGASGTIGRSTIAALRQRSAPFKVGARALAKAKGLGFDAVEFDWDNPGTYEPALRGADHAFLLPPISDKQVEQGKAFVAAAKRAGVKHLVKLSVIGARFEPGIFLGRQHGEVEKVIEASGLGFTHLRPTFFMQNFVNYYGVDLSKAESTVYLPHGTGKASWVDARDVGEVAAVALTSTGHEGKAYDLTGGEALSDAEVTALFSKATGKKIAYVDVPEAAAREAMTKMQAPGWLIDGFMELHGLIKNGYSSAVADGVSKVTGKKPRTFAQYVDDVTNGRAS